MKLKIFLGTLFAVFALVALKYTVANTYGFFKLSETIHIVGVIVLIYKLFVHKSCSGLSLKSQELTAIFLISRLICSIYFEANLHTLLDSLFLLSTLVVIWFMRFKLKSSYLKEFDTIRLVFLVVPAVIMAILINPTLENSTFIGILWAFTSYLESVSIFPQLRYMQNAKMVETFTGYYVFALGVSRFFALAHWIIQIYETRGAYLFLFGHGYFWFTAAFVAEMIQSFILADFCYYYVKSCMRGQLLRKMPI